MTTDERISKLEGAYEHLATKADVESLRADLKSEVGGVKSEISDASLSTVKWIVGVGVGLLAAQTGMWAYILSRLP